MREFTEIGNLEDIPPGKRKRVELNGELISVFNLDGEVYAIYDRCPHKKTAPLIRGILSNKGIKCPNHGYRFDFETGKCDRGEKWDTRIFEVKIEDGKILVGPPIESI